MRVLFTVCLLLCPFLNIFSLFLLNNKKYSFCLRLCSTFFDDFVDYIFSKGIHCSLHLFLLCCQTIAVVVFLDLQSDHRITLMFSVLINLSRVTLRQCFAQFLGVFLTSRFRSWLDKGLIRSRNLAMLLVEEPNPSLLNYFLGSCCKTLMKFFDGQHQPKHLFFILF